MTRRANLTHKAQTLCHLTMQTWSPGDGVTRYRFFDNPVDDYHAGHPLYTAYGLSEAHTFLNGYYAALRRSNRNPYLEAI